MSSAIKTPAFAAKASNILNEDNSSIYSAGEWSFKNASAVTGFHVASDGTVGIATTPKSWAIINGRMQIGPAAAVTSYSTNAIIGANWYYSSGGDKYILNAASSIYKQEAGVHTWWNAPTGAADAPLTFTERMRIDANGRVCIHRTSGAGNLNVQGDIYLYSQPGGAGTNPLRYNSLTGAVTYDTSSLRYKDAIRDSIYGLEHILKLRSTQFEYKDTGRSDVGLIAEEVFPIIPELVVLDENNQPDSVSYDRLVSVLCKAIQEQQAMIEELKAKVSALESK